jgi:predicted flap endonuclease-1-like 5' DNA nuclease
MDNRAEFIEHLRRQGKKTHVAEELALDAARFESFVLSRGVPGLAQAQAGHLEAFVAFLEAQKKGEARKVARGLGLYFAWIGRTDLAKLAFKLRETAIAGSRTSLALKEFRGVDPAHLERLAHLGITRAAQMLAAGKSPTQRQDLARQTGLPLGVILELVQLSDLSRIAGVKGIRARLYHAAGVHTVDELAAWEPEALRRMVEDFICRSGFEGSAPLPKEVNSTIATARKLPRQVEFEDSAG